MTKTIMAAAAALAAACAAPGVSAETAKKYDATWESLNSRPCPGWWKDAKFGIFVHWGVYSVPAYAPYDAKSVCGCYAEHYGNPVRWRDYPQFPAHHDKHHRGKSYSDFDLVLMRDVL